MANQYSIDKSHSTIGFAAKHMVFTTVRGKFEDYDVTVESPSGEPAAATISAVVKTASVNTGDEKRDGHLRSADFFNSDSTPDLTFKSTSIEKVSAQGYKVNGDLTILGVTRPITLDATLEGEMKDPWGNTKVIASARGKINRKEWGLNWNAALEAGALLVSENIDLEIEAQFAVTGAQTAPAAEAQAVSA